MNTRIGTTKRRAWARWVLPSFGVVTCCLATWAWWFFGHAATQHTDAERTECLLPTPSPRHPHPGMEWVPPGTMDMGDDQYPEEQPIRRVNVAGFWMDRTEVTNDAFAAFVKATGYVTLAERRLNPATHPGIPPDMLEPGALVFAMPNRTDGSGDVRQWWRYVAGANWRHPGGPATSIEGRGAFPVVAVTHEDALAYAAWKGRSLPSEAQWEWAARAGSAQASQDHAQPLAANTWQGLFPVANSAEDGFVGLAPVGCYAPNAWGLFDLIGNAWELTADLYRPQDPATGPQHVIKGGSYLCAPNYCRRYRAGARQGQEDDLATSHLGFRTVLIATGPSAPP